MESEPRDPDYAAKVRASFARQRIMALLGASLGRVEPGLVEIELPVRAELTQQHGYVHAGVSTTIADSAGGYAAFSLMPPDSAVLTIEFKVNLVAPADGERLVARGRVVRPGRRVFVSELEVRAVRGGRETVCLVGLATNLRLPASDTLPPG
jgi:uncharacterized protein (TIGR00369 family)